MPAGQPALCQVLQVHEKFGLVLVRGLTKLLTNEIKVFNGTHTLVRNTLKQRSVANTERVIVGVLQKKNAVVMSHKNTRHIFSISETFYTAK